ncbi:MAG: LuxR C-terminal-related transcriptional regulator [Actinomycetota bacterium]
MREGDRDRVEQARAALRAGDAAAARRLVEPLAEGEPTGDVLEVLARADYLDLDFASAIAGWERAYAAHRAQGDQLGAVRVARTLAGMHHSIRGDFAVSAGWLARAQTLLEGTGDRSERGWVALNRALFEPDRATKNDQLREALAQARAAADLGLEVAALAYLGASLVHGDDVDEGMRLLDEALAALAGGEVDDFSVLEEAFCQLFSACEHARDVHRADQWIRTGEAIAARRKLPAVSAFCRTHYGGVLTTAGRWNEADEALTAAARLWALGERSSIQRGGALVRLADLRVRQGRYEEAEQLLADVGPWEGVAAARLRAAIHLARGEVALAREVLDRVLVALDPRSSEAGALLEVLVEVLLAEGEHAEAAVAVDRLGELARHHDAAYLRALAAQSRARLCLATGEGDPQACLREALTRFERAQMPLELARCRLELARALAETRPEVARIEARAALEAFERLEAARPADAAAALLRTLGVRSSTARQPEGSVLTRREQEVLDLLGRGLSNPEIAERLYISRKTVEHHVSNILAKLGLRSRAEAAAYSLRRPTADAPGPGAE